jgi:rubredoxin
MIYSPEAKGMKNWWICSECDYVTQAERPPQECPQCKKQCLFSDVTCYIPECGGPNNLDVRLVALKNAQSNNSK